MNTVSHRRARVRSTEQQDFSSACTALVLTLTLASSIAHAGPREQARRIHDRLVGIPPTSAVIDSMETKVGNGDAVGAAMEAMENPAFYNTTLREFATPWPNREQSVYVDLNDSTATVIGMIRVFTAITVIGVGDPAQLAGGISEALITTAAGLTVAIPSLIFYRHLKRKIDELVVAMEQEAMKLVEFLQGDRKSLV